MTEHGGDACFPWTISIGVMFFSLLVGLAQKYLLAPQVPLSILIACLSVGVITLLLHAPLTSIVLMAVVARAGPDLLGLITLSAVTAMLVGRGFQIMIARRTADESLV